MAKRTAKKKDNSKKAGLIAFGATLITYALIFPFHKLGHFVIGGALAALAGWVVKIMATPMKGLEKNAKAKTALEELLIEDEYARGMVETGVQMLDALKDERTAISEHVFTRRIDEIRAVLDKTLRHVIDDPDKAHRLRRMNSYYLPTAVKLLQSYRSAKQQGASYMSIAQTREDVLATLDKLHEALTTLLDGMLKDDLEEMDVEIDVFEQMLKSDGLHADEVTEALRRSAHVAAKEMPMTQTPQMKPAAPTLNTPAAGASARQLQQGAPVLQVPAAPAAPDFTAEHRKHEQA